MNVLKLEFFDDVIRHRNPSGPASRPHAHPIFFVLLDWHTVQSPRYSYTLALYRLISPLNTIPVSAS